MTTNIKRIEAFRAVLKAGGLSGFIVPLTDEHLSEYVGAEARRLAWLTGFESSAGTAVILADRAALFVDGRYAEQARRQTSADVFEYCEVPKVTVAGWLGAQVGDGAIIGYDPWLHRAGFVAEATAALAARGATLQAVDRNPVDTLWEERPAPSAAPATPYPLERAGESAADKQKRLLQAAGKLGADTVLVAALDALSWLFNLRGRDVAYTPVVRAFALVGGGGSQLFIAPEKISPEVRAHLGEAVEVFPEDAFADALRHLKGRRVLVDPQFAAAAIHGLLREGGAQVVLAASPLHHMKACKNAVELAGMRAAHRRDGLAMVRFLHSIEVSPPVDEKEGEERIDRFRTEVPLFQELSFATISATGGNAALPHYQCSPETNLPLRAPGIYLVDSGGQYLDGTTDITRTMALGTPTDEMRRHFTLVLKGHIALALTRFPEGTKGSQIDALARQYLWGAGLDYKHGTGHGVGHYLSVHEGPQRIASSGTGAALEAGMVVSNEPGYYPSGKYGIRIESLVVVVPDPRPGDEEKMLAFETITLVPIDRRLIAVKLLDARERAWLDQYHARVREAHLGQVEGDVKRWLLEATAPLG